MSSRWTEYLETNYNFSPASSRIHLYNCIIEWTLCSIMKVCHIVVQTKSNHSFSYTEINFLWTKSLTPYKSDCNYFSSKMSYMSGILQPGDWLTEPGLENLFLLLIRDFVQKAGAISMSKSISKSGVNINNFWGQLLHSENLQLV